MSTDKIRAPYGVSFAGKSHPVHLNDKIGRLKAVIIKIKHNFKSDRVTYDNGIAQKVREVRQPKLFINMTVAHVKVDGNFVNTYLGDSEGRNYVR